MSAKKEKIYKVLVKRSLIEKESIQRLKESIENILDNGSKVIILEEGSDIKPIEQEYYGLLYNDQKWILNKDGSVAWYPCREIAEVALDQLSINGVQVATFNGVDELSVGNDQ